MMLQDMLSEGVRHHLAGRLSEAEKNYRLILSHLPEHPHTLQLLGVVAYQMGKNADAVALIERAIAREPLVPEYHNNLGITLLALGRVDDAIATYKRAITLKTDYADAHINLGNALRRAGQHAAAATAYRNAIAAQPSTAKAHNNLGLTLADLGQKRDALAAIEAALVLDPNYVEASINRGAILRLCGLLPEAVATFRELLARFPQNAEVHNNLAVVLLESGQIEEALATARTAVGLKPAYADGAATLGNVLLALGHADEAIGEFRRALHLEPGHFQAWNGLGGTLFWQGELDGAVDALERALRFKPDFFQAKNNLGNAYKEQGCMDRAIQCFREAMHDGPDAMAPHDNLILALHHDAAFGPQEIAAELRRWADRHAVPLRTAIRSPANSRDSKRRLRVGYISADLRTHAIARFLLPLWQHHDRRAVEVFAYADVPVPDAMTGRLRAIADEWRAIQGKSDEQVAEQVRRDAVDILVDLSSHTAGHRLLVFARRPAPVQVTWLAYASSTGLDMIDYRLTDPFLDPVGTDVSVYSERCIRLPHTYWCYSAPEPALNPGPLPATANGKITFGCLNNFCKVTEQVIDWWTCILRQAPGARLLLHAHPGSHRDRVRQQFEHGGIDAERIEFVPRLTFADYLPLYQRIDLALDTFPYGGGTTTCDALWMGVPVVTLSGRTGVSRAGASLLANVGLSRLVASSPDEYVQLAAELAADRVSLADLRSKLRSHMLASPLMDGACFARAVEAAYRMMWRKWCKAPP